MEKHKYFLHSNTIDVLTKKQQKLLADEAITSGSDYDWDAKPFEEYKIKEKRRLR